MTHIEYCKHLQYLVFKIVHILKCLFFGHKLVNHNKNTLLNLFNTSKRHKRPFNVNSEGDVKGEIDY